MSPRTGRPKAEKPLTIEVKARIDSETNEKLNKYCEANGVTRTEVVREGINKVINEKKITQTATLRKLRNVLYPRQVALSEIYYII